MERKLRPGSVVHLVNLQTVYQRQQQLHLISISSTGINLQGEANDFQSRDGDDNMPMKYDLI